MSAIHRTIKSRIVAGLREGKSTIRIAAEIGITRRAVDLAKAKLRREGAHPAVDAEAALRNAYLLPTHSDPAGRSGLRIVLSDAPAVHAFDNLSTAMAAASQEATSDAPVAVGSPVLSDRDRIVAIIERECGQVDAARILDAARALWRAKRRPVSFRPIAVQNPSHPFRLILGETGAALLAIKIVAAGLGQRPIHLARQSKTKGCPIRPLLLSGLAPEQVAKQLKIPVKIARARRNDLAHKGLLPRRRARCRTGR